MTHTPGPWAIGYCDGSGCGSDGEGVYINVPTHPTTKDSEIINIVRGGKDDWGVEVGVIGRTEKEKRANARLIAASPDLLAALKYARRFLKVEDVDVAYIDAAIAKATEEA